MINKWCSFAGVRCTNGLPVLGARARCAGFGHGADIHTAVNKSRTVGTVPNRRRRHIATLEGAGHGTNGRPGRGNAGRPAAAAEVTANPQRAEAAYSQSV
jgi:hypothetical protein